MSPSRMAQPILTCCPRQPIAYPAFTLLIEFRIAKISVSNAAKTPAVLLQIATSAHPLQFTSLFGDCRKSPDIPTLLLDRGQSSLYRLHLPPLSHGRRLVICLGPSARKISTISRKKLFVAAQSSQGCVVRVSQLPAWLPGQGFRKLCCPAVTPTLESRWRSPLPMLGR